MSSDFLCAACRVPKNVTDEVLIGLKQICTEIPWPQVWDVCSAVSGQIECELVRMGVTKATDEVFYCGDKIEEDCPATDEQIRDAVIQWLQKTLEEVNGRGFDMTVMRLNNADWWITGGPTSGDSPTEAYDLVNALDVSCVTEKYIERYGDPDERRDVCRSESPDDEAAVASDG